MKKRKKVFFIFITLAFFLLVSSTFLDSATTQDYEEIEINFSAPEFFKTGVYDFVRVPGASFTWNVGKPMLPVKGVQVLVDDREIDRVEVVSSQSEILEGSYYIQPVQHPVANFTMPEVEPDPTVYDSNNLYPEEIVKNTGISRMRDYPILNLLVYPLQYKPKSRELTFYRNLKLRIYYKHSVTIKTASQIAKEKRHESELFDNVVKNTVVNPDKVDEIKSERDKTYSTYSIAGYSVQANPTYCSGLTSSWADSLKYLIITGPGETVEASEPIFDNLERLAEWKKKKGVPAKVANYTDITSSDVFNCVGQDTAEKVRNFIKDVYDMWGIEYVLMGGRSATATSRTGYGYIAGSSDPTNIQTDLYYSDLDSTSNWSSDGNSVWGETTDTVDLTPDIFIGRIVVYSDSEASESSHFVNRTLIYEKNPNTDYLNTVLFLAELADANGHDGASVTNYTNATFVPSYWTATMLYEYLGNLNGADAKANISLGYHIVNHDGHGSESALGMGPGNEQILASEFDDFTNGYNLSIFYTAACDSISFTSGDTPSGYFIGMGNENSGGVAWIGSTDLGWYSTGSTGPYPDCNDGACYYSGEFNHQWFNETFNGNNQNLGVITARSKNYFVPQASSDGVYRWLIYSINLIGDPETPVWTNVPENFSVQYLVNGQAVNSMQVNESINFTVRVTNQTGGNVLSGARVCLWQDNNIYNYTTTDSNGDAIFELTPNSTGDVNVTITKQNFFPLEENTSVADEDLTAPTTTLNLPDDFFNTSSLEITFNFTSFDNVNLSNVSLWHNFTDWAINESNVSAENATDNVFLMNFTEGQHVWGVYACDNSSNCGWSDNRTFTIDVTEPLISIEGPDNNTANTTSNSIDFTFNVTDFLDIVNCSLMINDAENFTLNNTPKDSAGLNITVWLNSGDYNWSINCSDLVSNYNGTFSYNLSLVDLILPEVTLHSPADGLETSTNALDANFTVTEVYLDTCELWGNWSDGWHLNQSYNGFTAGITQNFTNISIPEGQYVWSVYCNDTSNNYNNTVGNRTFTVDNTAPTVSQKNPVNGESWTTGSVTFTYQVTDFSSISSCALYINNSQNSSSSSISKDTNQTFSATLFNDEYEWYVKCTDGAGNGQSSDTWYLTQNCSESWTCTDWSTCTNSAQTRTCTDANNCPAQANKPSESQSCSSGGSTGGGGGGGGGGGPGLGGGVGVSETVSIATGSKAGETKTLTFSKDVSITGIDVTLQNNVDKMTLTVEKLTSKPEETTTPAGTTYSYLKIDKNLKDEDVSDAKIRFKIEKTWLTSKGFLADEIILKRYTNKWSNLPTKKIKDDTSYTYYEADTEGFSYFAIIAEKKTVPIATPKPEGEKKPENETAIQPTENPQGPKGETKPNYWTYALILVAATILIALILKNKIKKKVSDFFH
jgi:PGF-pre-PGF domain-containing protein